MRHMKFLGKVLLGLMLAGFLPFLMAASIETVVVALLWVCWTLLVGIACCCAFLGGVVVNLAYRKWRNP